MDLVAFKHSLTASEPPQNLSLYLKALWYEAKGEWQKAHELIQNIADNKAAWVHAFLHRKEGDLSNAGYWYRKAGKENANVSLEQEWQEIVQALL